MGVVRRFRQCNDGIQIFFYIDIDVCLSRISQTLIKGEEVIATITPNTIEDMNQIIKDLDSGEEVNGWEDGMGNTIWI